MCTIFIKSQVIRNFLKHKAIFVFLGDCNTVNLIEFIKIRANEFVSHCGTKQTSSSLVLFRYVNSKIKFYYIISVCPFIIADTRFCMKYVVYILYSETSHEKEK